MQVFVTEQLTEDEQLLLAEVLKHPILTKYFKVLANNTGNDMLSALNKLNIGTEEYMRGQFYYKGQLDCLSSLLDAQQIAAN